jgi:hypothetical protein
MDLAAGVYLSEAPSCSMFLFGVVKQFLRYGIWSNTQWITPVYALHKPDPILPLLPYPLYTVNTYPCTYSTGKGVGGGQGNEKVRGALVHKRGRKYQHD